MIVTSKKVHVNKLKNKTKSISYKKRINISNEQMELETVIFQYTLDAKQAVHSHSFYSCVQELQNNLKRRFEKEILKKLVLLQDLLAK